ncbi:unnamed protein product [Rhizophagus irregularis]|nr:unnamed protein product [Rhizophagus irregularis]
MSTITLSCLVVGENPYENAFTVEIDTTKLVSFFRDVIKENQKPFSDNVAPKELKLWIIINQIPSNEHVQNVQRIL